ncbi:M20 family metallopeptidase [Brevibacterium casei]|uniref:Glutamate carboxypeptidase n=2 Tax=Bacteria TaxID=2 RepID=A0A2H1HM52_9MICO|nr:M20 family metallopeptidase [Brevibacterium casei]SIG87518.1 Carboxypeptidase G2 precursor [Mycobacteroides abscessus subsp. abscessus]MCT1765577.1 M20 family metallopeptidase [Brevibacterium casei]QPR38641.1 M20 family metallopeptidase [Brevibacterium casei]QPR42807.1 M20 family metallopeptidase [Brevibacterium casei]QQT70184.1 M20 family metallopeptidase [Brevibacterium casei]
MSTSVNSPTQPSDLVRDSEERLPAMLADLARVIGVETPSSDKAAVARGASDFADLLRERLGAEAELLTVDGVTHVRLRFGDGPPRVVLLNHQDTVWPHGTIERLPFSTENGVVRGPGSFDMLTGAIMSVHAVAILADRLGEGGLEGLSILITGDEEVGSVSSSDLIRAEAAEANAVFVMEASADGALKLERKGTGIYTLVFRGRASHAGLEPEKGVNAGMALALTLPLVAGLSDAEAGTTVVPTTITAGTTSNTVPAEARVSVDVRARTAAELERVDSAIRALAAEPTLEGSTTEVIGGINRPPFEPEASAALFDRATVLASELGIAAPLGVAVGGASDGNFTAGDGIPTLDGLGAVGDGAHAEHEHAVIAEIAPRTALLAALIADQLAK